MGREERNWHKKLYAQTLWGLGAKEKALDIWNDVLDYEAEDGMALCNKGHLLTELNRYDEAISVLVFASELYPEDWLPLDFLSVTYIKKGEYKKALEICEKVLVLKPDHPTPWYNKACSYSRLDDLESAIAALKKAIEYSDEYKKLAREDSDFDTIREDTEFKKIVGE